jgi:hypothetical protein
MVPISTETIWLKSSAECGISCLTDLSQPAARCQCARDSPPDIELLLTYETHFQTADCLNK